MPRLSYDEESNAVLDGVNDEVGGCQSPPTSDRHVGGTSVYGRAPGARGGLSTRGFPEYIRSTRGDSKGGRKTKIKWYRGKEGGFDSPSLVLVEFVAHTFAKLLKLAFLFSIVCLDEGNLKEPKAP